MPLPRTEVVAATVGSEIVVLGGLTLEEAASTRVDAYSPARNSWRRLPDLPIGVHHSMAVGAGGKLYVLGGYTVAGMPLRTRVRPRRRAGGARCPACRSRARRPAWGSREERSSSPEASRPPEGSRETRSRSISGRSAGRSWSVRLRASTWVSPRSQGPCTRSAGEPPASTRIFCISSRIARATSGGRRLSPVPDPRGGTGAAALLGHVVSAGGEEPGRDDRGGPRVPRRRPALDPSRRPARHLATASGWRRSADACSSSEAGRSRASP